MRFVLFMAWPDATGLSWKTRSCRSNWRRTPWDGGRVVSCPSWCSKQSPGERWVYFLTNASQGPVCASSSPRGGRVGWRWGIGQRFLRRPWSFPERFWRHGEARTSAGKLSGFCQSWLAPGLSGGWATTSSLTAEWICSNWSPLQDPRLRWPPLGGVFSWRKPGSPFLTCSETWLFVSLAYWRCLTRKIRACTCNLSVWPLNAFLFRCFLNRKQLTCLCCVANQPFSGRTLFSCDHPATNFYVYVLSPWRAFWADTVARLFAFSIPPIKAYGAQDARKLAMKKSIKTVFDDPCKKK